MSGQENISKDQVPGKEQSPGKNKHQKSKMETHSHHLHHAPGKKFWHYFYEFLMLFLAVFCGFLAEYTLEHRIEKERGRQFIESFYEDLKADTLRISLYINFDGEKLNGLADLGNCYDTLLKNMRDDACLMNAIKYSSINKPFIRTDRTLKQLANAGGFRLLKREDADSIILYDVACNNFQDFQSTVFQDAQDNVRSTLNTLGNFKANEQMFKPTEGKAISAESLTKEDVTAPLLFTEDKTLLNKYFNELKLYYRVTYNHRRTLLELKKVQIHLIEYFKNKYHYE